jgi:hypothetical protein
VEKEIEKTQPYQQKTNPNHLQKQKNSSKETPKKK